MTTTQTPTLNLFGTTVLATESGTVYTVEDHRPGLNCFTVTRTVDEDDATTEWIPSGQPFGAVEVRIVASNEGPRLRVVYSGHTLTSSPII